MSLTNFYLFVNLLGYNFLLLILFFFRSLYLLMSDTSWSAPTWGQVDFHNLSFLLCNQTFFWICIFCFSLKFALWSEFKGGKNVFCIKHQVSAVYMLKNVFLLTFHRVFHILSKQIPHHFSTYFTHIELLGKSWRKMRIFTKLNKSKEAW